MADAAPREDRLTAGTTVELDVRGLGAEGEGVGRAGDLVVFVRGAIPGDRVEAVIEARRRSFARARIGRVVAPSPSRVEAPCPHQRACGGCPLMTMAADAALEAKAAHLAETLRRIGGVAAPPVEVVPSPSPLGYRSRVRFAVRGGLGAPRVGFRPRARPQALVEIDDCLVGPPGAAELARGLLALLAAATRRAGAPWPDEVELRRSASEGRWLVALHGPAGPWPEARAAAERLVRERADVAGVVRIAGGRGRRPGRAERLAGASSIRDRVAGIELELDAETFVQVNPGAADALYRAAASELDVRPGERLLDLYCGAGLLGLVAAPDGARLVGVEASAAAVRAARRAARAAGRGDARFLEADAEREAVRLAAEGRTFEKIAANPPRAGLGPALPRALAGLGAARIVLVSCHPASLARDVGRLAATGYAPRAVTAVDMFPHTSHLEAIVRLERA